MAWAAAAFAQLPAPLQHEDTYGWENISDSGLSPDGRWLAYSIVPWEGDGALILRSVDDAREYRTARGKGFRFTDDSRFLIFLISAESAAEKSGDTLGIVDLREPDRVVRVPDVSSFRLPRENTGWIAYLSAASLVARHLEKGTQMRIGKATAYEFSRTGKYLAYFTSGSDGAADGAHTLQIDTGLATTLLQGKGDYKHLTLDDAGTQAAFLSNRAEGGASATGFAVYRAVLGKGPATAVVRDETRGIPAGWRVSEHSTLSFSRNGRRLFFGTAPMRRTVAASDKPQNPFTVDIWNWKDPYLQSMQLTMLEQERRATYQAVLFIEARRVVQLADENLQKVSVGQRGDADVALGEDRLPYRQLVSWDRPHRDFYLLDVRSGRRARIIEKLKFKGFGEPKFSPDARYLSWWDSAKRVWYVMNTRDRRIVEASRGIPYPVHNVDYDESDDPPPFARPQWAADSAGMIIADEYDVWLTDPEGRQAPRNLTLGLGRREHLRFRPAAILGADPDDFYGEHQTFALNRAVLLGAFDLNSKASGYYRDRWDDRAPPAPLIMRDMQLPGASGAGPQKARFADVLLFSQENFRERALWASDLDFRGVRKLSSLNSQQAGFRWGSAELASWYSADGRPLQGIVFKPDGFDPAQRYPLIVQLYERNSDDLHKYRPPHPDTAADGVSTAFYVSRGYVVFMPDIRYELGHPGESAQDAVIPGVLALVQKGFVDPKRIGLQGHSWGGYQSVDILTRSNLFAAAAAGAPVVNMTSAYGGIRLESGASRMWQYEHEQSRIGQTLWQAPLLYLKNSPLFFLDKIQTPLLILHNVRDGAVPWAQGIELFSALRRLQKPAWLFNYNGEGHHLTAKPAKDWAIRLQQFFDRYLQGASPPVWLEEGVPAVRKGETLGLELISGDDE